MQIENHKEEVPFSFYEEKFKTLDPAEVTQRLPFVGFDGSAFAMELLGEESISPSGDDCLEADAHE